MSFALRDHTADVAVEATAPTLSALFEAVADGLAAASCEEVPESGDRFSLSVRAESREALLFDYLDRLIYERDVRLVLPADHRCSVSGPDDFPADGDGAATDDPDAWTVDATARGVPLGDVAAREIKAVTYSEMTLEPRDDGWYAYVVFDV
ncbi:archease [Halorubrum depositum]|uniref:archease n=1 Tax=Halorubrum depositum TaxID=2583992 RepID=UPI0011A5D895|nr:archease [Halorubrum depositum]